MEDGGMVDETDLFLMVETPADIGGCWDQEEGSESAECLLFRQEAVTAIDTDIVQEDTGLLLKFTVPVPMDEGCKMTL